MPEGTDIFEIIHTTRAMRRLKPDARGSPETIRPDRVEAWPEVRRIWP